MNLTVGRVAELAGITVRTLHHYDEVGLVSPQSRSDSGYRLYGEVEIDRLQEVLFFRELGFGLEQIREIIDEPDYNRTDALVSQRRLVERRAERLMNMMDALDVAIEASRRGITMNPEEKLEVFGDFDPDEHAAEAEERWGDTDAYQEAARRTSSYAKSDWQMIKKESEEINERLLDLMAEDVPPDSEEAMDIAEEHRDHITKWFYECTKEIHAGLGEMYMADVRFKENIDKAGDGLAEYLSAAIAANSRR